MKQQKSQQGFINLYLLAALVGILLVTGLGQYLWRHSLQVGAYCQQIVAKVGLYELNDGCQSLGLSMASFRNRLESMVGSSPFGNTMNLEEFAGHLARSFSTQFGFQSSQLNGLIDPNLLTRAFDINTANATDKLRMALTQGAIGHQQLGSNNPKIGLQYLQSSANMGEFGVLSQLSLGSAYASGSNGMPKNPLAAQHYNTQALQSIETLQKSNSPQSQKLLSALPGSPDKLVTSLRSVLKK